MLVLMGALIGMTLTKQGGPALDITTDGVTYGVDSVNVGSGFGDRAWNTSPLSLTGPVRFTNSPTPSNGAMSQAMKIQQSFAPGE